MIRQTKHRSILFILIVSAVLLAILAAGCTEPSDKGSLKANRPPESRLSNVPPPGTISTSPLVSLSWLGDDADGFVVAYRYRWSFQLSSTSPIEYKPYTYILNIMVGGLALIMDGTEADAPVVYKYFSTLPPEGLDTTRLNQLARGDTVEFEGVPVWASNPDDERYPAHESPSRGTFIFDSQDTLNPHTFEVSAIDNNGALDPSPATVDFFTPIVPPPDVLVSSGPSDTVLVLDDFTDTYEGTVFTFQGFDPNSRTIEYSWIVDRDEWPEDIRDSMWSPFSLDPTATVKGSDLPEHYRTNHRMYVRARNEFGSISTRGYFTRPVNVGTDSARQDTFWAYRDFNTIYPEFAKPGATQRILIINNTFDWDTLAVPPVKPSRDSLTQYYREMYDAIGLSGKYDIYNVTYTPSLQGTWPGLGVIGQYSLVHIVGDVTNDFNRVPSISLGHQGKITDFCNVGGKVLINGWNLTRGDNMPPSGNFWNNILHILTQVAVTAPQFVGARHQTIPDDAQYPDVSLDQAKLDSAWLGAMPAYHIYQAYGFGEIIYRYDAKDEPRYDDGVVGIRYIGLTYDVIYLGFPLYYIEQPAAIEVLRKALRDLHHL
jgi:hypothetical protein